MAQVLYWATKSEVIRRYTDGDGDAPRRRIGRNAALLLQVQQHHRHHSHPPCDLQIPWNDDRKIASC